jgi:uncharacterized RDD family membrane protein YckC
MKCPKCGYLGFEPVDRCRNCGYDFSLSTATHEPQDLPIRTSAARVDTPADLPLVPDRALAAGAPEQALAGSLPRPAAGVGAAAARRTVADLPLFPQPTAATVPGTPGTPPVDDDEPLITRPSPPRPPLAVRRATPEVPRVRVEQSRMQLFDTAAGSERPAYSVRRSAERAARSTAVEDADESSREAAISARIVAVIIDLLILAATDAIVIYFTMKICGVTVDELAMLPKVPLLAFLLVQNGGYLVAFTAGGQTLGKMAVDIRVVPADEDQVLDLGRACVRTGVWLVLAVPAGLGFLTALFTDDRRALHDRLAGTRVVRASA